MMITLPRVDQRQSDAASSDAHSLRLLELDTPHAGCLSLSLVLSILREMMLTIIRWILTIQGVSDVPSLKSKDGSAADG